MSERNEMKSDKRTDGNGGASSVVRRQNFSSSRPFLSLSLSWF